MSVEDKERHDYIVRLQAILVNLFIQEQSAGRARIGGRCTVRFDCVDAFRRYYAGAEHLRTIDYTEYIKLKRYLFRLRVIEEDTNDNSRGPNKNVQRARRI